MGFGDSGTCEEIRITRGEGLMKENTYTDDDLKPLECDNCEKQIPFQGTYDARWEEDKTKPLKYLAFCSIECAITYILTHPLAVQMIKSRLENALKRVKP